MKNMELSVEEVAREMLGFKDRYRISITGIAGLNGGTKR